MQAGNVGFVGSRPLVTVRERTHEQAKYESMWARDEYRAVAPGEDCAQTFLEHAKPPAGSLVIDFGAGTGRGAVMLCILGGVRVHMTDLAENCLDSWVRDALKTQSHALSFEHHDLNKPLKRTAEYGYCTDVLEHIPPEELDGVLTNILRSAQHVFFQVSCVDDCCGKLIGEKLHLSVHDYAWWLRKFQGDLECLVHWSEDRGDSALFYVTAWWSAERLAKTGVLNVENEELRANVRASCRRSLQQCRPHGDSSDEVMIVGGGPSLSGQLNVIRARRESGQKLITLNGAYNWATANGLSVSAQIMCDAREFNRRFLEPVQPQTKYLLASQCHPSAYDAVPAERTWQWHTTAENIVDILNEEVDEWFAVPGGCTVLLRAIPLMRMLGYRSFHLFGCDSCLGEDDSHHAYSQPENDGQLVIPATIGGRVFRCHPWQIAQAWEFIELIRHMGNLFEIEVHGGGLLAHILEHAAAEDLKAELAAAFPIT